MTTTNLTSQPIVVRVAAVGSTNPAKVQAAANVIARVWPAAAIGSVSVESGVRPQPLSDEEAIIGAQNRAINGRAHFDADLGVGIEGNTVDSIHGMFSTAWVAVVDRQGVVGLGAAGRFLLPDWVADAIRNGAELGPLMDEFIGEQNTKQRQGAVGILTGGLLTRGQALETAVALALARFVNSEHYR
jgi:inosine/xanthosine triphosphatase